MFYLSNRLLQIAKTPPPTSKKMRKAQLAAIKRVATAARKAST